MPLAAERNVGVVVMCAVRTIIVNPELLRETIRQWKNDGALAEDALDDAAPMDWVLGDGVTSLADAAYRFAAEDPSVSTVLSGTANVAHLEANVRSIGAPPLSPAISQRLKDTFIPANKSVLLHAFRRRP